MAGRCNQWLLPQMIAVLILTVSFAALQLTSLDYPKLTTAEPKIFISQVWKKTHKNGKETFFKKEKKTRISHHKKLHNKQGSLDAGSYPKSDLSPSCELRFRCRCLPEATHSHELSAGPHARNFHIFHFCCHLAWRNPSLVLPCSCHWPGDSCRLHIKVGNGMQLHGCDFGMWPPCVSTASAGAV